MAIVAGDPSGSPATQLHTSGDTGALIGTSGMAWLPLAIALALLWGVELLLTCVPLLLVSALDDTPRDAAALL
jgi:hypothetical protein